MCEPIPFVRVVNGSYVVTPEAEQFWSSVKEDVAIVVVVGKYRTGKSFLMNRCLLADQAGGFNVGSTVNSCTKGIWVYPKVVEVGTGRNKRRVVVMDSEGIGALDTDSTHDTKIFALALLLSSQFVYNSMGSIDETAIDTLSLVLKISEQVRVGAADEETNAANLAAYMPRFKWVVRDFVLRLENEAGSKITSNQYLENALADTGDPQKNGVRTAIRDCFSTRSCTTLVRPCTDEEKLQDLDTLPFDDMRPNFVNQLKELRNELIQGAPPKRLMGHDVSGKMLVSLAKSFCDAINKGAAPVIKNSWALMCEIKDRDLADDCLREFEEVTSTWGESAIPVTSMKNALDDLITETMKRFAKSRASTDMMNSGADTDEPTNRLKHALQQRSAAIVASVRGNITRVLEASIREVDMSVRSISPDEITWPLVRGRISRAEEDLTDRVGQGSDEAIALFRSTVFPFVLDWSGFALNASEQRSEKAKQRGEEMCTKLSAALEERDEERARAEELVRRISGADEALEKLKQSHSAQIAELEKENEEQLQNMQQLDKETLAEKDELVRTWIAKCQTAQEEVDSKMQRIVELENDVQALEKRAKAAEEAAQDAQNVKADLDEVRKNEVLTQQNQTLTDTIEELQVTLEARTGEVEQLKTENETAIAELQTHAKKSIEDQSERFAQTKQVLETRLKETEARLVLEGKNATELVAKAKQMELDHAQNAKRQKDQQSHTAEMLETERRHCKDLVDQMEALREEHKQVMSTNAVQQRATAMENQAEINKLYEKIMIMEAESQETLRTREGDLKQCQERIRHNKRQHEEYLNEIQELKKVKLENDQAQKNLTKVTAENDLLRVDKNERTQRLNEYKSKASELEKEKASLERKLLMAEFKTNV